LSRIE